MRPNQGPLDFTPDEMMTIAASRALKSDDVCFVGIGAPSAACNVARLTHAPDITLIYESGTIGTAPDVLPHWTIASIAVVPGGAHPSYTSGYYSRDNASYLAWDEIAADRDRFLEWMDRNVINSTPAEFASRVAGLRAAA